MLIYTGQTTGKKLKIIESLNMGICISSTYHRSPSRDFKRVPCFIDNGAFTCWQKGYPFQDDIFLDTIRKSYKHGIKIDFIVCPDIVTGGLKSLDYSVKWSKGKLETCQNLALAVQDGMESKHLNYDIISRFKVIFVGGSKIWKWKNAEKWIKFAHDNKKNVTSVESAR